MTVTVSVVVDDNEKFPQTFKFKFLSILVFNKGATVTAISPYWGNLFMEASRHVFNKRAHVCVKQIIPRLIMWTIVYYPDFPIGLHNGPDVITKLWMGTYGISFDLKMGLLNNRKDVISHKVDNSASDR